MSELFYIVLIYAAAHLLKVALEHSRLWDGRRRAPQSMRYPWPVAVFFGAISALFAAAVVYSLTERDDAAWIAPLVLSALSAGAAVPVQDYFMTRHRITQRGLVYRKFLGARGRLD